MKEISSFHAGYTQWTKATGAICHTRLNAGRTTGFTSKFASSLVTLYEIALKGAEQYILEWNRHVQGDNFHYWITWDSNTNSIILDAGNRTDEWSQSLVDNLIEDYNRDAITEWVAFTSGCEYKELMDIVTDYYDRTGQFFSKYVQVHNCGGILGRSEYERLVLNKYAQKVIKARRSEPKFTTGALADFKTTHHETADIHGISRIYKSAPNGLLILSNTEPIISAVIGAKRYKAVAVGDTKPFYIEERFLKKRRKR